jgi:hypothetical protein
MYSPMEAAVKMATSGMMTQTKGSVDILGDVSGVDMVPFCDWLSPSRCRDGSQLGRLFAMYGNYGAAGCCLNRRQSMDGVCLS